MSKEQRVSLGAVYDEIPRPNWLQAFRKQLRCKHLGQTHEAMFDHGGLEFRRGWCLGCGMMVLDIYKYEHGYRRGMWAGVSEFTVLGIRHLFRQPLTEGEWETVVRMECAAQSKGMMPDADLLGH